MLWAAPAVRIIAEHTGTVHGVRVRPGDIYQLGATLGTLFPGSQVAADSAGNLLTIDGNAINVYPVASGRYYGEPMRAKGDYLLVGDYPAAAIRSALWDPQALAIVPGRGFVIMDGGQAKLVLAQP